MGRLNEEMKDTEFSENDETFNDVVRDFAHLTFNSVAHKRS